MTASQKYSFFVKTFALRMASKIEITVENLIASIII